MSEITERLWAQYQAFASRDLSEFEVVYLFDLAQDFTAFYEHCPVMRAEEPVRTSRLALCDVTARTLNHGLGLLGIDAPESM